MDLLPWSLLLVTIMVSSCVRLVDNSKVTRGKEVDKFSSTKSCLSCARHGASCSSGAKTCCKECKCPRKSTFYRKGVKQFCVADVGLQKEDVCEYYVASTSHGQTHRNWISLPPTGDHLGFVKHTSRIIYPQGFKCGISKVQYWNLKEWKMVQANFSVGIDNRKFVLKLDYKDKSKLQGLLVKLELECLPKANTLTSCTMLKILGQNEYKTPIGTKPLPTSPTITSKTTTAGKHKKTTLVTTVTPVQKNLLIVIIIAVVATLVVVTIGVVIWCCCLKRKKGDGKGAQRLLSNDPNYHRPDNFPGRTSAEVNGSANNLAYLQPVDAMPKCQKKSPGYDYPHISLKDYPQQSSPERPIYAEVTDIRKPDYDYSKPWDLPPQPQRTDTRVVGVPGYQPPSGMMSDSGVGSHQSGYSSLGVNSTEEPLVYQTLLDSNGVAEQKDRDSYLLPTYAEVLPDGRRSKEPDELSDISI